MQTVDQIITETLLHEGGYVNDPDDPGGATNHGVTIGTMRRLNVDVDGDGDVDVQDVKLLTVDQARDIYKQHYFFRPKIDQLPSALHANVFDMYVNAGGNAIKVLQRMVNTFGVTRKLSVDGALGPMTIKATHDVFAVAPDHVNDAYAIARRQYYFALADRRAKSRKYARTRKGGKGGWIRRAEAHMSPRFQMTAAEFNARVARW